MKYNLRYWYSDLTKLTGHENGAILTEHEVNKLSHNRKFNTMLQHTQTAEGGELNLCWIDDRLFSQR